MLKKKIAQAIEPAAEAKQPGKEVAARPKKNKITFKSAINRVSKWWRELKSEFKKVVWPTKKQNLKNTGIVLIVLVIVGVIVGVMDYGFQKLILEQLLKLATGY